MLMLLQTPSMPSMQTITLEILDVGIRVANTGVTRFAMGIFFLCFFFHLIEGSLELFEAASSSRLFKLTFWMRIFFTLALLIGYRQIIVNTAIAVMPNMMLSLGTQWLDMYNNQVDSATVLQEKEKENKELTDAGLEQTQGGSDDGFFVRMYKGYIDSLITLLGLIIGTVTGLLLTCLVLFEGFMVLGVLTLLVAVGPLCVAFLAHEKTEGFFWSYFKAWFVYGLLYIPFLCIGMDMATRVLQHMSSFSAGAAAMSSSTADVGMHFVMVFIGPFVAYAMIKSVSTFLSIVFTTGSVGSGMAGFVAAASSTASAAGSSGSGSGGSGSGGSGSGSSGSGSSGSGSSGSGGSSSPPIQATATVTSSGGSPSHNYGTLGSDVRGE